MSKVNDLLVRLVDIYAQPDLSQKEFGKLCRRTLTILKSRPICAQDADFRDVKRTYTEVEETFAERANFCSAHRLRDIIASLEEKSVIASASGCGLSKVGNIALLLLQLSRSLPSPYVSSYVDTDIPITASSIPLAYPAGHVRDSVFIPFDGSLVPVAPSPAASGSDDDATESDHADESDHELAMDNEADIAQSFVVPVVALTPAVALPASAALPSLADTLIAMMPPLPPATPSSITDTASADISAPLSLPTVFAALAAHSPPAVLALRAPAHSCPHQPPRTASWRWCPRRLTYLPPAPSMSSTPLQPHVPARRSPTASAGAHAPSSPPRATRMRSRPPSRPPSPSAPPLATAHATNALAGQCAADVYETCVADTDVMDAASPTEGIPTTDPASSVALAAPLVAALSAVCAVRVRTDLLRGRAPDPHVHTHAAAVPPPAPTTVSLSVAAALDSLLLPFTRHLAALCAYALPLAAAAAARVLPSLCYLSDTAAVLTAAVSAAPTAPTPFGAPAARDPTLVFRMAVRSPLRARWSSALLLDALAVLAARAHTHTLVPHPHAPLAALATLPSPPQPLSLPSLLAHLHVRALAAFTAAMAALERPRPADPSLDVLLLPGEHAPAYMATFPLASPAPALRVCLPRSLPISSARWLLALHAHATAHTRAAAPRARLFRALPATAPSAPPLALLPALAADTLPRATRALLAAAARATQPAAHSDRPAAARVLAGPPLPLRTDGLLAPAVAHAHAHEARAAQAWLLRGGLLRCMLAVGATAFLAFEGDCAPPRAALAALQAAITPALATATLAAAHAATPANAPADGAPVCGSSTPIPFPACAHTPLLAAPTASALISLRRVQRCRSHEASADSATVEQQMHPHAATLPLRDTHRPSQRCQGDEAACPWRMPPLPAPPAAADAPAVYLHALLARVSWRAIIAHDAVLLTLDAPPPLREALLPPARATADGSFSRVAAHVLKLRRAHAALAATDVTLPRRTRAALRPRRSSTRAPAPAPALAVDAACTALLRCLSALRARLAHALAAVHDHAAYTLAQLVWPHVCANVLLGAPAHVTTQRWLVCAVGVVARGTGEPELLRVVRSGAVAGCPMAPAVLQALESALRGRALTARALSRSLSLGVGAGAGVGGPAHTAATADLLAGALADAFTHAPVAAAAALAHEPHTPCLRQALQRALADAMHACFLDDDAASQAVRAATDAVLRLCVELQALKPLVAFVLVALAAHARGEPTPSVPPQLSYLPVGLRDAHALLAAVRGVLQDLLRAAELRCTELFQSVATAHVLREVGDAPAESETPEQCVCCGPRGACGEELSEATSALLVALDADRLRSYISMD